MALDIYLINKGIEKTEYELYHSRQKNALEKLVEQEQPCSVTGRIKKFFRKYVTKRLSKMQNNSIASLKAASLVGEVNINYSSSISKKEAKRAYRREVRRQIKRNSLSLGFNLFCIAFCYIPPLTVIPYTSVPFAIIGWHALKNISAAVKGKKNVSFTPSADVSSLESMISGETEYLKNKDLLEYYSLFHGDQDD